MDHLAVCGSNILKLGGCLHLSLIHNPEVFFCSFDRLFMFYGYKQTLRFGAFLKKRSKVINMGIK
jgi:hypothetical protein